MTPEEQTEVLRSDIAEIYEGFHPDTLDDPLVMQRFGQMCKNAARLSEHLIYAAPTGKARKDTDATNADLPLFNSLARQEVGSAVGEDSGGRHQHQESDIERAAGILRQQQPTKGTPGRPRATDSHRLAREEAHCALKDTADPTDACTCGHARVNHVAGSRSVCTLCTCEFFLKKTLTIHDERAAAHAEGNQPDGTFRIAKNQTCGICGQSKPHVCRRGTP